MNKKSDKKQNKKKTSLTEDIRKMGAPALAACIMGLKKHRKEMTETLDKLEADLDLCQVLLAEKLSLNDPPEPAAQIEVKKEPEQGQDKQEETPDLLPHRLQPKPPRTPPWAATWSGNSGKGKKSKRHKQGKGKGKKY